MIMIWLWIYDSHKKFAFQTYVFCSQRVAARQIMSCQRHLVWWSGVRSYHSWSLVRRSLVSRSFVRSRFIRRSRFRVGCGFISRYLVGRRGIGRSGVGRSGVCWSRIGWSRVGRSRIGRSGVGGRSFVSRVGPGGIGRSRVGRSGVWRSCIRGPFDRHWVRRSAVRSVGGRIGDYGHEEAYSQQVHFCSWSVER